MSDRTLALGTGSVSSPGSSTSRLSASSILSPPPPSSEQASSSTSHEESSQHPFSANVKPMTMDTRTGAIRLRDRESGNDRLHLQATQPLRWDDIEDVLESLGIVSPSKYDEEVWSDATASHSAPKDRYGTVVEPYVFLGRGKGRKSFKGSSNGFGAVRGTYETPQTLADRLQKGGLHSDSKRLTGPIRSGKFKQSTVAPYNYPGDIDNGGAPPPIFTPPDAGDDTLTLLLPLLVLLSTLVFLLLVFVILVIFVRRRARIALTDGDGPLDVGREEELEGMGGLDGVEERWLEQMDDATRRGYMRSKDWALSFPPGSQSSEITLSQFLSIQEKGVSAWSFDPDYESNPGVFVAARTEIAFMADGEGMAPQEGGGCSVQSNLPLPKLNDVYYWEVKMFTKPDATNIAIGLATKPFPSFRMPGWNKFSVGYFSADGFKCHNYPFAAQSYGPAYNQGDVIGVGYRPRSGTVFFTRNGKKLEDAFVGLNRYNLFPTIGADGAAEVHVNLGQSGFVFIEANVKKWGLAPMVGTLAPPPPYGMERGSILIETSQGASGPDQPEQQQQRLSGRREAGVTVEAALRPPPRRSTPPPPLTPPSEHAEAAGQLIEHSSSSSPSQRVRARRIRQSPELQSTSRISRGMHVATHSQGSSQTSSPRRDSMSSTDEPHNPPTPNHLDISLHSLDGSGLGSSGTGSTRSNASSSTVRAQLSSLNAVQYVSAMLSGVGSGTASGAATSRTRSPSPPPYSESRAGGSGAWSPNSGGSHNQVRRSSGRTHAMANALLGALTERGLLTPLSGQDDARAVDGSIPSERAPLYTPNGNGHSSPAWSNPERQQSGWLASWFR